MRIGYSPEPKTDRKNKPYTHKSQEAIDRQRVAQLENFAILRLKGVMGTVSNLPVSEYLKKDITLACITGIDEIKAIQKQRKIDKETK